MYDANVCMYQLTHKCTLVQALRLCTGRTADGTGGKDIALLFHDHGTRRGEGSASRPCRFLLPGKTRYQFYRRLGGPQGRSENVRKISPPPGFDPQTVQPVASRYTDWAIRPTINAQNGAKVASLYKQYTKFQVSDEFAPSVSTSAFLSSVLGWCNAPQFPVTISWQIILDPWQWDR
jgi:hypothetical protein